MPFTVRDSLCGTSPCFLMTGGLVIIVSEATGLIVGSPAGAVCGSVVGSVAIVEAISFPLSHCLAILWC